MGDVFIVASKDDPLTSNAFEPGETLCDRYEILNFHAAGGMQEVYRCFDKVLGRNVALKTPKRGVKDRRFRRGAEMGARVNHPNIATTFDYYEDNKITFLVEEFVEGTDLGKRLEHEFYFLDPSLGAHVVHHIAKALKEAHRVGICHRDLKPSNIMTSNDLSISKVKLTDFGIAKLAESEIEAEIEEFTKNESTLTSSNTLLGAVPYMAPECFDNWKTAGQPMDIWALGCVAYHVLAGAPPFGSGTKAIYKVAELKHGKTNIEKPKCFGSHASITHLEEGLWELIQSCIQVDPRARPTAVEIIQRCEALCYSDAARKLGVIQTFPTPLKTGGTGNYGFIRTEGGNQYFHGSDFFGPEKASPGRRVSFCVYPGFPDPRVSPVLLLKTENE